MTTQITTTTSLAPLNDYHIQLTGSRDALPVKVTRRRATGRNPPKWSTKYRRVPPHRPVNKHLDLSERPNGSNTGEWVFVNVMLNGVRLNSVSD